MTMRLTTTTTTTWMLTQMRIQRCPARSLHPASRLLPTIPGTFPPRYPTLVFDSPSSSGACPLYYPILVFDSLDLSRVLLRYHRPPPRRLAPKVQSCPREALDDEMCLVRAALLFLENSPMLRLVYVFAMSVLVGLPLIS